MKEKYKYAVQKAFEVFVRGRYEESSRLFQDAIELSKGNTELLVLNKIVSNFMYGNIANLKEDINILENSSFSIFVRRCKIYNSILI